MELRRDLPNPADYRPPEWLAAYPGLHMNPKNPLYPSAVADVLDVMNAMGWSLSRAAVMLGVSSSALTRFLYDDPALWTKVSQDRAETGMKPLRKG